MWVGGVPVIPYEPTDHPDDVALTLDVWRDSGLADEDRMAKVLRAVVPAVAARYYEQALTEAADEVQKERRWQVEQSMRQLNASPHNYTEERLEVIEKILRSRAAVPAGEPQEAHDCKRNLKSPEPDPPCTVATPHGPHDYQAVGMGFGVVGHCGGVPAQPDCTCKWVIGAVGGYGGTGVGGGRRPDPKCPTHGANE
jgi:hypothetical protein